MPTPQDIQLPGPFSPSKAVSSKHQKKEGNMHDPSYKIGETYQHSFSQLNPLHILNCIYICRSHGDFHKFHLDKYQDLMHIRLYLYPKKVKNQKYSKVNINELSKK